VQISRDFARSYTTLDVKDILIQAKSAVLEAELPEDLRQIEFSRAIDLLTGGAQPQPTGGAPARDGAGASGSEDGTAIGAIAKKLRLEPAVVREVYGEANGEIELLLGPNQVAKERKAATCQIALLIATGRQAAGLEEFTEAEVIRKLVDDFGKLDSSNFAKTVADMTNVFSIRGSGRSRSVGVKRTGFDEARALVLQLTGGAS
jgi:hypothetical protein